MLDSRTREGQYVGVDHWSRQSCVCTRSSTETFNLDLREFDPEIPKDLPIFYEPLVLRFAEKGPAPAGEVPTRPRRGQFTSLELIGPADNEDGQAQAEMIGRLMSVLRPVLR
jgi:hypothetical protein